MALEKLANPMAIRDGLPESTMDQLAASIPMTVPRGDLGIVTLADANYFPGLLLLHQSAQESFPVPVACFDIGLTDAQRVQAEAIDNLWILPLPEDTLIDEIRSATADSPKLSKPNKRIWPLWVCPILIAAAPFRRVFWMDCDIAILRNLEALFTLLEHGPVFTLENNAPELTPNHQALYELLPIRRQFDFRIPTVNAGLSGWDLRRDRDALAAYVYAVDRAMRDTRIRDAISWHDQGALIWAIQYSGLEHRVLPDVRWNRCIRHSPVAMAEIPWGADFLTRLKACDTETFMLHWNGAKPPWTT